MFFPGPPPKLTPQAAGLAFETVELAAADGTKLHGWWIEAPHPTRSVVVFHGNAGSVENRLDLALLFHGFGWSTLLFDYRGFGLSSGSPSVAELALDADAAFDWAAARSPGLPLVAWGESLGGGVAAELSTRRAVAVLVLEKSFTALGDIAASAYPFLPVRWLLRTDLQTRTALGHSNAAVFVLHGRDDRVVPFAHGKRLFEAAREPKELCEFRGGHNDRAWAKDPAILARLRQFVAR